MSTGIGALRRDLHAVLQAAFRAVDAERLLTRALAGDFASHVRHGASGVQPLAGSTQPPLEQARYHLIAVGKAARGMASAATDALGPQLCDGVIITPEPVKNAPAPLECVVGGHPTPTPASELAGRRALAIARAASPGDCLLLLLSGGASALMSVPADDVSLEDKRHTTNVLLRAGADIHALNAVRKHLSVIKGGWLAATSGCRVRTLAISDVVDDDLSTIGSGPGVPDPTTFQDALDVLHRFGSPHAFPAAVVRRLKRGVEGWVPETPKPGDVRLAKAEAAVIGSRNDAMNGASEEARSRGYHVLTMEAPVTGEARDAGRAHGHAVLKWAGGRNRPLCVISSGETTVRVTGAGRGGRNQEFALAIADVLRSTDAMAVSASVGTDGIDGPTDAAGAIADSTTMERARQKGLDPRDFLARNDSYTFFCAIGDLIHTGPTGTNVGDLQIVLVGN